MLIVQKYGGSSLADEQAIAHVAAKVQAAYLAGHSLVVVCSAMGKTTEQLLAMADAMTPGARGREVDMLVTAGERIAAALLSLRLQHLGVPAVSLTGSQSGIVTDGSHQRARILCVRPERVRRGLAAKQVVVVAGFQGVSEQGDVTSLGRGGSDTTAVALAAALGADACDIYSDVDGVYSADPRLVPDAHHLPHLDYGTMQRLADGGARVLHATAVALAAQANIVINARDTHRPKRATRIGSDWLAPPGAIAVSLQQHAVYLRCKRRDMWHGALAQTQMAPDCTLLWSDAYGLLLGGKSAPACAQQVRALLQSTGVHASVRAVALLCVVGQRQLWRSSAPIKEALGKQGIAAVCVGGDAQQLLMAVPQADGQAALRAAHAALSEPLVSADGYNSP